MRRDSGAKRNSRAGAAHQQPPLAEQSDRYVAYPCQRIPDHPAGLVVTDLLHLAVVAHPLCALARRGPRAITKLLAWQQQQRA